MRFQVATKALTDQIKQEPFLAIEAPEDSYFKANKTDLELGCGSKDQRAQKIVSPNRWRHIKRFMLIEPNAKQLYIAANLQFPHYHLPDNQFKSFHKAVKDFYKGADNLVDTLCRTENYIWSDKALHPLTIWSNCRKMILHVM